MPIIIWKRWKKLGDLLARDLLEMPFSPVVVFKLGQQILGHELVCPEVYALLLGRRLTPALLWTWELL